jgi:hypothetical protein
MLHEPRFWATIFFLGEFLAGGVALVEKRRKLGIAAIVMASLGLLCVGLFWPESNPSPAANTTINTNGGGTGGTKAGGGGGGAGAPGGNGGTYIEKQLNTFGSVKTVALARVCSLYMAPISIPPSSMPTYILQMHPQIAGNKSGWVPLTMMNTSDKPYSWPPSAVAKGHPCCDFSTYRCDFQNLGDVPFLSVNVEFLAQFPKVEPKGYQGTPPIELQAKTFVITETLDAKQKFTVYLVNASHRWVYCWYPIFATVQVLGENAPRKIPVASSTATFLDSIQFATLAPTQLKWQGLP